MKQESVGFKVVPDVRRVLEDGRFPLKLRVTYKGERKYYGTGYNASNTEWEVINSVNTKGSLKKVKLGIAIIETEAAECAKTIVPFSFKIFEQEHFDKKLVFENLNSVYNNYISQLRANGQLGTATSYQTAINALSSFKKKLAFEDITPTFLQNFENWMVENGKSVTSVGIYLRTLRAILNLARDNGAIKNENYPFGRRKYVIPTGKNIKKALSIDQVKQIFAYKPIEGSGTEKAKDFWVFSYLCNGINFMDVAFLRWSDVDAEKITFERAKTKRTKRANPVKIVALRNQHLNAIIEKWGRKNDKTGFVFNIISDEDSGAIARAKVQQFTKVTNKWMKRMGHELEFDIKLTTYVARHSFATILVRSGAPLAFASQSLGHSNVITTQKYFAGFDLKTQAEYTRALTAF